jgi:CheY-like chemotaxis protein
MSRTVLAVDDDVSVRRFIRTLLSRWGYEVKEAKNGGEAIDLITRNRFDLIICDVRMPVKDGWEVLRVLRSRAGEARETPVILLTGCTGESDMFRGYAEGANYYIAKPFTPAQLFYGIQLMHGDLDRFWKAG